jgi:hypothetical protein
LAFFEQGHLSAFGVLLHSFNFSFFFLVMNLLIFRAFALAPAEGSDEA